MGCTHPSDGQEFCGRKIKQEDASILKAFQDVQRTRRRCLTRRFKFEKSKINFWRLISGDLCLVCIIPLVIHEINPSPHSQNFRSAPQKLLQVENGQEIGESDTFADVHSLLNVLQVKIFSY